MLVINRRAGGLVPRSFCQQVVVPLSKKLNIKLLLHCLLCMWGGFNVMQGLLTVPVNRFDQLAS